MQTTFSTLYYKKLALASKTCIIIRMDREETEKVVKEFLELWQKQFAYQSQDGDVMRQGIDAFTQMQDAYIKAMQAGLGNIGDVQSSTASDIFRNISNEFGKLAKSYEQLEKRIARIETLMAETGGGSTKQAKSNTAKRSGKRAAKTDSE